MKWHTDTELKFKHRARTLTGRSRGISMAKRIRELTVFLRGRINYFGIGKGYQKCIELDYWIRRRLRMCFWKELAEYPN